MTLTLLVLICASIVAAAFVQHRQTNTLAQIHKLVNSRLTEALNDITALKKALVDERRHTKAKAKR